MVDCGPTADVEVEVEYVTVIVKPQVAVCPSFERAVTVTFVVPTGKLLPEAGDPLTVIGATPPEVVAV